MARTELGKLGSDSRYRFRATVERFGKKRNRWAETRTILLGNIVLISSDTTEHVADHLWFTVGVAWSSSDIGDIVEFDARVDDYEKGYQGRLAEERGEAWSETDWRLTRPTKVKSVGRLWNDWQGYLSHYGFTEEVAIALSKVLQDPKRCHPSWFRNAIDAVQEKKLPLDSLTYESVSAAIKEMQRKRFEGEHFWDIGRE